MCAKKLGRAPLYRTRISLETWERAVALVLGDPPVSALALQGHLALGSYHTALRTATIVRNAACSVKWPRLKGDVEWCELKPRCWARKPRTLWFAVERRSGGLGQIRVWDGGLCYDNAVRRIGPALAAGATVITPPGCGYQRKLLVEIGVNHRAEALNGAGLTFRAATALARAFLSMLSDRKHHRAPVDFLDPYLGEFVFRHNASALGWSPERQVQRVMTVLRAPALSA